LPSGHQLDGVSLAALLVQGKPLAPRTLFWGYNNRFAMRDGPWKLVVSPPFDDATKGKAKAKAGGPATTLYHLGDDVGEKKNLATQEKDRVNKMETALAAWRKDVAAK